MTWSLWVARWQAACAAAQRLGGEVVQPVVVDPPATEREVASVEQKLGFSLPPSFRRVLLDFSARVEMWWQLPDGVAAPGEIGEIFSGQCGWNLSDLFGLEGDRISWVESCFPDPDDEYDAVWHNKLAFYWIANGDLLAIDLASRDRAPVVYLSHDGSEENGFELGLDFIDFIDRWSQLGCPGAEDWQWRPFSSGPRSLLDPGCENAHAWRKWFGLGLA